MAQNHVFEGVAFNADAATIKCLPDVSNAGCQMTLNVKLCKWGQKSLRNF